VTDAEATARAARTLLERLGARLPGFSGYLDRELRRELDQLVRTELAKRLDAARSALAGYARTLGVAQAGLLDRVAGLDKSLDGLANAVRHAGAGYGGLFDAVKVREEQLEILYEHDLGLVDAVDTIGRAAASLARDGEAVAGLERAIADARDGLERREEAVRGILPQRGAAGGGER